MPLSTVISKVIDENDLEPKKLEEITEASYEVVLDVYNAITFAAMNYAIVPSTAPQQIINHDATQFQVGYQGNKLVECIALKLEVDLKRSARKIEDEKGKTSFIIERFCVISAYEGTSEPVFIVADSSTSDDAFEVQEVQGLSIGT